MEYLGFKSTNDPLFKAETTMMRLKDLAGDREVEFYEAVDAFSQNAEEANSMAFVSSWGEANPGGGKDRVRCKLICRLLCIYINYNLSTMYTEHCIIFYLKYLLNDRRIMLLLVGIV